MRVACSVSSPILPVPCGGRTPAFRPLVLLLLLAVFPPPAPAASDTDAPLPNGLYATFHTGQGDITARLYETITPRAVALFVGVSQGTLAWLDPKTGERVKRPLYNNITFHRVIRGEMIQSGDPTGSSGHDCGYRLQDEFLPGVQFNRSGKLAIANTGEPNSGSCQFFITDGPVPTWNGHYTIFGEVVSGQDVVSRISHMPLKGEKPIDPVRLDSVTLKRVGPPPPPKRK